MIWGGVHAVPALGQWAMLGLGVVLGAAGVLALRRAKPARAAFLGGVLAVLLPVSAVALPFTFTNGTVADATQVNANLAALTPISGFSYVDGTPNGSFWPIMTPSFVAPRSLVCTVSTTVTTQLGAGTVTNVSVLFPSKTENGTVSAASPGPAAGSPFADLAPTAGGGVLYQATITAQYTVAAGSTVAFGAQMSAGGVWLSASNWKMTATYSCN
jgi:hypothetical protein